MTFARIMLLYPIVLGIHNLDEVRGYSGVPEFGPIFWCLVRLTTYERCIVPLSGEKRG